MWNGLTLVVSMSNYLIQPNHITGAPWLSPGSEVLTSFSSKGAMGIFSYLLHVVDLDGLRTRGKGAISDHLHLKMPPH